MNITGLILAGGRGARMASVDKGLQPFRGMPMVQHVMQRLSPQVDAIIINANQNLATYETFGVPVWPDMTADFAGPLAGLQAGLMHCETPLLVTAPCDAPFLPADLVERLYSGLISANAELAVAVTGDTDAPQPQPVFCLLKTSLLTQLAAFLQSGQRKVDAWNASVKMVKVHFPDNAAFRNINTPEDLRQYEPD